MVIGHESRADMPPFPLFSIIGDSSKVFFKRLRMERVLHLLMILCANTEASLPSTGSTIPLFISSRRRLTVST